MASKPYITYLIDLRPQQLSSSGEGSAQVKHVYSVLDVSLFCKTEKIKS